MNDDYIKDPYEELKDKTRKAEGAFSDALEIGKDVKTAIDNHARKKEASDSKADDFANSIKDSPGSQSSDFSSDIKERHNLNEFSHNDWQSSLNEQTLRNEATKAAAKTSASGAESAATATAGAVSASSGVGTSTAEAVEGAGASAQTASAEAAQGSAQAAGGSILGPLAILTAELSAAKRFGEKSGEEMTGEKDNGWGFIASIVLLIFLLGVFLMTIFGPIFVIGNKLYKVAESGKEAYQEVVSYFESTQKEAFFKKLFPDEKNIDGYITMTRTSDEETVEVLKEIIDYSIYKTCKEYLQDMNYSISDNIKLLKEGYNPSITYNRMLKQPYPYALAKNNGEFYTVKEFIKDYNIDKSKRNIQNNDLNYAEFFAILMQSERFNIESFNYSDFYDLMISEKTTSFMIEVEIGEEIYIRRKGLLDDKSYLADVEENEEEEPEDEELEEDDLEEEFVDVSYIKDFSEEDINEADIVDLSKESEKTKASWWKKFWGGYNVYIHPAGLRELYAIIDSSPLYINKYNKNEINKNFLDYNEEWVRAECPKNYLGPAYNEKRNSRSSIYYLLLTNNVNPSGRSSYSYGANYITEYLQGVSLKQTYANKDINLYSAYTPVGSAYILNMYSYINQLSYPESIKRGTWDGKGTDNRSSIQKSGCIDCCYIMVYEYFYRKNLSVPQICEKYVNKNADFEWGRFMRDYGFTNHEKKYPFSKEQVRASLAEGRPVIMYLYGPWTYGGITYKRSIDTYHYIVIMGYDEQGFYVYDPANKSSTQNGPIPYEAFSRASQKTIFLFDVPPGCNVSYMVQKSGIQNQEVK